MENHICLEGDSEIVPQKCEKTYCGKEFVSSTALKNHMKSSHFGTQRKVCTKCGEMLNININIKKHNDVCGKSVESDMIETKSKIVCKHWRRGRCDRGSKCNFSHVGQQDTPRPGNKSTKSKVTCRNGPSCSFLARGKCNFEHHINNRHQEQEQQIRRPIQTNRHHDQVMGKQSDRLPCKFGAECDRVPNCPFIHSLVDFPQ